MKFCVVFGWSWLLSACWLPPAFAESMLRGDLVERYPASEISGAQLVGAFFGDPDRAVDPNQMSVYVPQMTAPPSVCLRAETRDGLYRAEFSGVGNVGEDGFQSVDPSPAWRHKGVLAKYKIKDFAVIARQSATCGLSGKETILPVRTSDITDVLFVKINTQRAVNTEARLFDDAGWEASGVCSQESNNIRSVSFSATCAFSKETLDLSRNRKATLEIRQRLRTGRSITTYSIMLAD